MRARSTRRNADHQHQRNVLRAGSGLTDGGQITTIKMVANDTRKIQIGRGREAGGDRGANDDERLIRSPPKQEFTAAKIMIADAYVPAGATSFTVADAKGFNIGDTSDPATDDLRVGTHGHGHAGSSTAASKKS